MVVYVLTVTDRDGAFLVVPYPTEEEAKADASYRFGKYGLCDWYKSASGISKALILDFEGYAIITPHTLDD